jgi:NAD-dependent oxidoreductase involved in siderophore biosynthesis
MTADEGAQRPANPLERLDALGGTLDAVTKRLAQVAESSRRTRHLAIGLTISIVLDVILTVVVTLLTVSALDQGTTLHASQLSSCAISNQTRVEQAQLWQYLFDLSGPPKTAQAKAAEQKLLTYVDKTFAPVNCAQVYKN